MARLQILELPSGPSDNRPSFVLVVDQHQPLRYVPGAGQAPQPVDEFEGIAEQIGARAVLVFHEPVEIPDNQPLTRFEVTDSEEHAGTRQIVYAHERTRLDLCSALLLSGDTTWRQLVEQAGARQRELAGLYEVLTRVRNLSVEPEVMNADQERLDVWRHGYKCGVLAARSAATPRNEETSS